MDVFLIRHAEAIDDSLDLADAMRPLSALGRDQARQLGERLRWHDCVPTHVWTSPLVRAVQTAELVAGALQWLDVINVIPALAHGGSPRAVAGALAELSDTASVLVVGHEPGLSMLAALLSGGRDGLGLVRAEAMRITGGRTRWRFTWDAEAPVPAR